MQLVLRNFEFSKLFADFNLSFKNCLQQNKGKTKNISIVCICVCVCVILKWLFKF